MKSSTNDQSISFNQEMVTAILNNRKTQTRRLIEPKKAEIYYSLIPIQLKLAKAY